MDKEQIEELLTVSYDKLITMGACDEGLEWFADNFGINSDWPLRDVMDDICPISTEFDYFTWYFEQHDIEINYRYYCGKFVNNINTPKWHQYLSFLYFVQSLEEKL